MGRNVWLAIMVLVLLVGGIAYFNAAIPGWKAWRFRTTGVDIPVSSFSQAKFTSVHYIPGSVFHNPDGTTSPDALWYGTFRWRSGDAYDAQIYTDKWFVSKAIYRSSDVTAVVGWENSPVNSDYVRLYVMKSGDGKLYYVDVPRESHVDFGRYQLHAVCSSPILHYGPSQLEYVYVRHISGADSPHDKYLIVEKYAAGEVYLVEVVSDCDLVYQAFSNAVPAVAVSGDGTVYVARVYDSGGVETFGLEAYPNGQTVYSVSGVSIPNSQPFVTAYNGSVYFGYVTLLSDGAYVFAWRYDPGNNNVSEQLSANVLEYGDFDPRGRYHFAGAVGDGDTVLVFGYPVETNGLQYYDDYFGGQVAVINIDFSKNEVSLSGFNPVDRGTIQRSGAWLYDLTVNPFSVDGSAAVGFVVPSRYRDGYYTVWNALISIHHPLFVQTADLSATIKRWTEDELALDVNYCGKSISGAPVTNLFVVSLWNSTYTAHRTYLAPVTFTPEGGCVVRTVHIPFSDMNYDDTYRLYVYTTDYAPEDYAHTSGSHFVAFTDVSPADYSDVEQTPVAPPAEEYNAAKAHFDLSRYEVVVRSGGSSGPLSAVQGVSGPVVFGLFVVAAVYLYYLYSTGQLRFVWPPF